MFGKIEPVDSTVDIQTIEIGSKKVRIGKWFGLFMLCVLCCTRRVVSCSTRARVLLPWLQDADTTLELCFMLIPSGNKVLSGVTESRDIHNVTFPVL